MTDIQLLILVIAIVFSALSIVGAIIAMIYSNKRMDDFQKHIDEKIDNGFAHMEMLLKLHEAEHHRR